MISTSWRTRAVVATLAAATLPGVSACGGDSKAKKKPTVPPSTAASSSSAPAAPAGAAVDPLRGGAVSRNGVVAV